MSARNGTTAGTTNRTLMAALALALTAGSATVVRAQSAPPRTGAQERDNDERVSYRSSIQVPGGDRDEETENDEKGESDEKGEKNDEGRAEGSERESAGEQEEAARLQKLARVTPDQARAAALARVPGQVKQVELDNEDGNLVYAVEVQDAKGVTQEVTVDAGNARVLLVEQDDR